MAQLEFGNERIRILETEQTVATEGLGCSVPLTLKSATRIGLAASLAAPPFSATFPRRGEFSTTGKSAPCLNPGTCRCLASSSNIGLSPNESEASAPAKPVGKQQPSAATKTQFISCALCFQNACQKNKMFGSSSTVPALDTLHPGDWPRPPNDAHYVQYARLIEDCSTKATDDGWHALRYCQSSTAHRG